MKVKVPGHTYELSNFEKKDKKGQTIQFIHKEPVAEGSTELKTVADGTTTEELIEVIIDRLNFLQSKFPCKENILAIAKQKESLMFLNKRTADRQKRNVEGSNKK